ncbi:hypothetical protein MRO55_26200, partial [Escherichia coli]|uniref:hypothetical protein n=1 Tax=Escherichia coli TaxID=562 RepID=UPI002113CD40
HLDLGADHLAARALADAKYPSTLTQLKDLQARSLVSFPFRWPQGSSSLRRKSLRLGSLLVDTALRREGVVPDDHPRYFAL